MTGRSLRRRISVTLFAIGMAFSAMLPALMGGQAAAYAQLGNRSIAISSSKPGATDVAYSLSFAPGTTGAVQGIVIDLCTTAFVGTSCVGPTNINTNFANLTVNALGGDLTAAWLVNGASTANKVVLTKLAGNTLNAGTAETLRLGTQFGANDGLVNPSTTGTFYARILTFSTVAGATGYNSGATGASNPPATTIDAGSVALSTATSLTVTARVAEQLQFCVGSLDNASSAPVDCTTGFSGSTVNLGVVDTNGVTTPVPTSTGGNNANGGAMVRTNAAGGVVLAYVAEQDSGTPHAGALRVPGATCNASFTTGTDQCINSAGTTGIAFSAAVEKFGMTVASIDTSSSSTPTSNLVRSTEYAGDGTLGNKWAWDETGTFTPIARSDGGAGVENRVVDDEMISLHFAAVAGITTPTGSYSVTSTYVATATF